MASEMTDDSDYVWQPPSEAEMKVILARRERDNQISQRMSTYLLKGYKMLASSCTCGNIMLQDRNGANYCIACQELDSDVDKDDPVRNEEAARAQVREQELSARESQICETQDTAPNTSQTSSTPQPSNTPQTLVVNTGLFSSSSCQTRVTSSADNVGILRSSSSGLLSPAMVDTAQTLTQKLSWATKELRETSSVEYSMQLCKLIKHCADALHSIQSTG